MSQGFSGSDIVTIIVSVVALLVAIGALVLAYQQVKLANQQVELAEKDVRLAEEQSASTKRQEAIAVKQAEIAETQHKIMQEQMGRKANLVMRLVPKLGGPGLLTYEIEVLNIGSKSAPDFYWWVHIPANRFDEVNFTPTYVSADSLKPHVAPHEDYLVFNHQWAKPAYPGIGATIARISVRWFDDSLPLELKWKMLAEDGKFPPEDDSLGTMTVEPTTKNG